MSQLRSVRQDVEAHLPYGVDEALISYLWRLLLLITAIASL